MNQLTCALCVACQLLFAAAPASAGDKDFPCGTGGFVLEKSNARSVTVEIDLTDSNRNVSNPDPKYGWPKTIELNAGNGYMERVMVGIVDPNPTPHVVGFPGICDIKQTTRIIRGANRTGNAGGVGLVADLELESIFVDPDTGRLLLQGLFATIAGRLGDGITVLVPDIFGDVNGDGVLGDGDTLYSMVDMTLYLDAIPTFSLGDTFRIVNGRVAGLRGMIFSSTPFTYNAVDGFVGSMVTLDGTVEALHGITPVTEIPEPSTWFLVTVGMLCLAGWARCERASISFH